MYYYIVIYQIYIDSQLSIENIYLCRFLNQNELLFLCFI